MLGAVLSALAGLAFWLRAHRLRFRSDTHRHEHTGLLVLCSPRSRAPQYILHPRVSDVFWSRVRAMNTAWKRLEQKAHEMHGEGGDVALRMRRNRMQNDCARAQQQLQTLLQHEDSQASSSLCGCDT